MAYKPKSRRTVRGSTPPNVGRGSRRIVKKPQPKAGRPSIHLSVNRPRTGSSSNPTMGKNRGRGY